MAWPRGADPLGQKRSCDWLISQSWLRRGFVVHSLQRNIPARDRVGRSSGEVPCLGLTCAHRARVLVLPLWTTSRALWWKENDEHISDRAIVVESGRNGGFSGSARERSPGSCRFRGVHARALLCRPPSGPFSSARSDSPNPECALVSLPLRAHVFPWPQSTQVSSDFSRWRARRSRLAWGWKCSLPMLAPWHP